MTLNEQSCVTFAQLILHFHHPKETPNQLAVIIIQLAFQLEGWEDSKKMTPALPPFYLNWGIFLKGIFSGFQYMYY